MQVFKTYMKVVKKNLFMALIYTGIFVMLIFMFSSSAEPSVKFEDVSLGVCVIDEDNSAASKALTDYIGSTNKLVEIENNKDEILDALYYTRADYVLTIRNGFEEKIKAGETENLLTNYQLPDSYDGVFIDNKIDHYISTLSAYAVVNDDISMAISKTADTLSEETEVTVETFSDDGSESTDYIIELAFFFTYLPYGLISVLISILTVVLIKMNKKEIAARTNSSSTPVISQTTQIMLGSLILVAAVWILFMLVGIVINGGMFTGKAWLAVLNSFVFTLVSAGIAILTASLTSDAHYVALIANIVPLSMSFLCGIFVEQSLLGENVIAFSRFLPAYWYIKATDMLAFSSDTSFNINEFMSCLGIEALFAVALFALVLLVRKYKHSRG